MQFDVLTLFPEAFSALSCGVIAKALQKDIFSINVVDIRQFSSDKHKKCDDYPYGGGAGMVMTPQPIHDAINAVDPNHEALRIFMSPKGKTFCQSEVLRLAKQQRILLLCGSYEGIDQRIIDLDIDEEMSLGDFVLTGGEIPAMAIINAVSRYIDGVLGSEQSTDEESFSDGLLEYPQYTRPAQFMGLEVPAVLLSGNHQEVANWRKKQQIEITKSLRPDLLKDNKNN